MSDTPDPDSRKEHGKKFDRSIAVFGLVLTAVGVWFAYVQIEQGSKGDTYIVNTDNSNNSTTTKSTTTKQTTVKPARVMPVESGSAPRPVPVQYFAGTSQNYLAVRADPSIAGSVRAAFDIGATLREISPRFYDDGLFVKAMNGDSRWRSGLDVPSEARNLYLIDVGPVTVDTAPAGGPITGRRLLQIMVVDLVNSSVRTKRLGLTAMAFTQDMLDIEFEQRVNEALRQNVSEIVKHETS